MVAEILLVEDDEGIRNALRDLLKDEGYEVATAWNGQAALCYLAQNPAPRLILLDLLTPLMDGFQFMELFRKLPGSAEIPVVVLSAVSDSYRNENRLGAVAYLGKPICLEVLLRLVRQYCGVPPLDPTRPRAGSDDSS